MNRELKMFYTNMHGTRSVRMVQRGDRFYVIAFDTETAQATPVEDGASYDFSLYNSADGRGVENVALPHTREEAEGLYEELRTRREYND